jgi:REP element-mobilizing transposase RayT
MPESFRRRRLPHWDVPEAACFLTTCLEGSIPARGLIDLERHRIDLQQRPRPPDLSESEWRRRMDKLTYARRDFWLDDHPAVRHLEDPRLARCVVDALYFFAGQRYDLLAFVVMPSHMHWVFQPLASWVNELKEKGTLETCPTESGVEHVSNAPAEPSPRQRIQHSINRHSALECNRLRGATGSFWQRESYDHWVRDIDELERIIRYVEANPVRSGLVKCPEEWPFSSAHDRKLYGLEFGEPLMRPGVTHIAN